MATSANPHRLLHPKIQTTNSSSVIGTTPVSNQGCLEHKLFKCNTSFIFPPIIGYISICEFVRLCKKRWTDLHRTMAQERKKKNPNSEPCTSWTWPNPGSAMICNRLNIGPTKKLRCNQYPKPTKVLGLDQARLETTPLEALSNIDKWEELNHAFLTLRLC